MKEASFYTLTGEEVKVERMNTLATMKYAEFNDMNARAVRLPFEQ